VSILISILNVFQVLYDKSRAANPRSDVRRPTAVPYTLQTPPPAPAVPTKSVRIRRQPQFDHVVSTHFLETRLRPTAWYADCSHASANAAFEPRGHNEIARYASPPR